MKSKILQKRNIDQSVITLNKSNKSKRLASINQKQTVLLTASHKLPRV